MVNSNSTRATGIDEAFALRMARAIERDPNILERNTALVQEVAVYPAAREVLNRIFKVKKVAHRFQNARCAVQTAAYA